MFHAPMGRFQLELFDLFFTVVPSNIHHMSLHEDAQIFLRLVPYLCFLVLVILMQVSFQDFLNITSVNLGIINNIQMKGYEQ